jgi:hypothetical protein
MVLPPLTRGVVDVVARRRLAPGGMPSALIALTTEPSRYRSAPSGVLRATLGGVGSR